MTKSQVDRLGERLKVGKIDDADLRMLDEYRRSYAIPYLEVIGNLRNGLGIEPTGRPAKSTPSIIDKLRRESIRLSQIQDVAGCRILVEDINGQDIATKAISQLYPNAVVIDRREHPSHGYRAVHVIVISVGKSIEIQVRTALQQFWAEVSEKLSDLIDPRIKYGGGPGPAQNMLAMTSGIFARLEALERSIDLPPTAADDSLKPLIAGLAELRKRNASPETVAELLKTVRGAIMAEFRSELEKLGRTQP